MHNQLRQNVCADHPNRCLANGPNHPGPGPEEIPMVDVSHPLYRRGSLRFVRPAPLFVNQCLT